MQGLGALAGLDTSFFGGRGLTADSMVQYLEANSFDPRNLTWQTSEDGSYIISMPEDQWDLIEGVDRNLFYKVDGGWADLGLDFTDSFDDEGNLVADMEKTWLSINDQPVCYYHLSTTEDEEGGYHISGRVPALLNGEQVNLMLVFDDENPYGYIAGAQKVYVEGETDTLSKGLIDLQVGDTLDFLCDFYTSDGDYETTQFIGEQMEVTEEMVISDTILGDDEALVLYRFTDIYQQPYWTEVLEG